MNLFRWQDRWTGGLTLAGRIGLLSIFWILRLVSHDAVLPAINNADCSKRVHSLRNAVYLDYSKRLASWQSQGKTPQRAGSLFLVVLLIGSPSSLFDTAILSSGPQGRERSVVNNRLMQHPSNPIFSLDKNVGIG